MRLLVSTPSAVVLDADQVRRVRAQNGSGAFGILPGHADFVTVLAVSVLRWQDRDAVERYVALNGGVLTVRGGRDVAVSSREAVADDDLDRLERRVLGEMRREAAEETADRSRQSHLHLAAIRRMCGFLRAGRAGRSTHMALGAAEDDGT